MARKFPRDDDKNGRKEGRLVQVCDTVKLFETQD